ncbi:MAG: C39 family peptidase [Candidatus Niyogibacteria bacterium]|nr:C39 family peptidase [Candidatus Niyogibacteria bacterium]
MKIITFPQLRQTYSYDCGAKALQAVLVYYGIEIREDYIIEHAKTSKTGTPIRGIINVAQKYGLKTDSREMTLKDIQDFIKKKIPVILVLQAWTEQKNVDWEKDWIDGHYVVAIGYTKDKILFEDPSSFERTFLKYNELEKRWHDADTNGKKYFHYGIAIFGRPHTFKSKKIIHMD